MMRRTQLARSREKPRRKAPERVPGRMKPPPGNDATPEQERYHASLRGLSCQCGCGRLGQCTHHILANAPGKVRKRDHWFVVRLTNACHNGRSDSVHGLGSEAKFEREHGVDLVAVAVENLRKWRAEHV